MGSNKGWYGDSAGHRAAALKRGGRVRNTNARAMSRVRSVIKRAGLSKHISTSSRQKGAIISTKARMVTRVKSVIKRAGLSKYTNHASLKGRSGR